MSDTPCGVWDLSTEEAINVHCYKAGIVLLDNYKCKISVINSQNGGPRRKVAGSIPDCFIEIFH